MEISKINALKIQNFPTSKNDDKSKNEIKPTADFSKLPDGVSNFNIDGFDVLIWKKGDQFQSQITGQGEVNTEEIYKKIEEQLNKQ